MSKEAPTRKILLIDDSAEDRDGVKAALLRGSTDKFRFLEAETCAQGRTAFQREGIETLHCIILDFSLPDGDATDVLSSLPTTDGAIDVPVLVLTGSGTESNREALRAGAHEYLGKSWMTPSSIMRAIENAIDRQAMLKRLAQSHAQIKESEERFRNMAEHMPAIMCVIEPDGQCSFLNHEWSRITGQTQTEGNGSGWIQMMHPDDRGPVSAALEKGLSSKKPFTLRCRIQQKNSDYIWILLVFSPRFAGKSFLGFVGSAVDLTDQKLLEEMVSERTSKLQETIGELESVSYSISHDMRQPLRSMQQYSQFLLEDYSGRLDDQATTYLQRIVTSSNRLDRLIQDVLTYSRLSKAGDLLSPTNLDQVVSDIVLQYPPFHQPGITIEIVGPLTGVQAHEALLTQIISNLLGNAVKFRSPDRPLHVTVSTESKDGCVRLWVKDNGIGIKPENLERIWKIFEQVHGNKNIESTGIGLSIVRKAAERMNGKTGVESELDKGSRFWVDLQPAHKEN